jgi:hypothetical protein
MSTPPLGGGVNFTFMSSIEFLLDFKLSPCCDCCVHYFGWFLGVSILCADVSEHSVRFVFIGGVEKYVFKYTSNLIPFILLVYATYEDGTGCSETSAHKNSDAGESPKRENTTLDFV